LMKTRARPARANERERCGPPINKEKPLPTITAHIVVRDAARAADWCARALGAEIGARIRVPDGPACRSSCALATRS
jgi:hypothetical protein